MKKQRWKESEKRREEKKKEDQRRDRVRRKKMHVRKKLEKSRNRVFFHVFPESVWAKGSSNSGGLPNIFTSSHLQIFTSSHPRILTPSHPHIFTSSHLHIFTSSHLHILTSSHLHILSCPFPALLPSCSLALFSFLLFYFSLKARGSANETARNATLSHETRFDRQKLKWNCDFTTSAATLSPNLTLA